MKFRYVYAGMIILAMAVVGRNAVALPRALPQGAPKAVAVGKKEAGSGPLLMERVVSLSFRSVSLREALSLIAQQADVRVQYRDQLLAAQRRLQPVTLQSRGITLGEAFTHVLAGTSLRAVAVGDDAVMIERLSSQGQQGQGTITGKVASGKTRAPVAGARVYLDDNTQPVNVDRDGTFRIPAAAGEHRVTVRAVGYQRQTQTVVVRDGQMVTLDLLLDGSANVLDEVVVTGSVIATERKEIPTPITVIQGDELEKRGITRVEQLFRGEVPGVLALDLGVQEYHNGSVGGGVSAQIYSRGSSKLDGGANPIKTFIDGVELMDPSYLGTIDPRSIERIEIITGPQAATIYGSGAMGGVMQIFTRRGKLRTPEVTVSARYGVMQHHFTSGQGIIDSRGYTPEHHEAIRIQGGIGADFSYSGSISYDYTGQWFQSLSRRRSGGSAGLTYTRGRLTAGGSVMTTGSTQGTYGGDARFGQHLNQYTDYRGQYTSTQTSVASSQTVTFNTDYRATATWSHHATLGRSQNVMALKPVSPNFGARPVGSDTLFKIQRSSGQRVSWSYNTSYVVPLPALISSSLSAGASGSTGDQVSITGCLLSKVATTVVGCTSTTTPGITLPLNSNSWGGFGQWRLGLLRQLYATFGARFEQNPTYGRSVKFDFTPTSGLTYTLEYRAISLKLMGSYGRATRAPTPDQRNAVWSTSPNVDPSTFMSQLANPDLRPEYSRGPQGGIELYVGNLGSLTLNHYQQKITDLIQRPIVDTTPAIWVPDGSDYLITQFQYVNVASMRQFGWEGTASLNTGPLALKGSYSWNDSRVLAVSSGVPPCIFFCSGPNAYSPGQSLRDLPTHFGSFSISYARGATNVTLVANRVGPAISNKWPMVIYEMLDIGPYIIRQNRDAYINAGGFRRPGYTKTNLSGSHRLTSQWGVELQVVNLTNKQDSDNDAFNPSIGRQTTVGFSYRFKQ